MVKFIYLKLIQIKHLVSVRENVLLIQSNHHPFFAVSSLQALRLLLAAAWWQPGGAAATADLDDGCCAQQSREDVEGLLSTRWTLLASRSAGPACQ